MSIEAVFAEPDQASAPARAHKVRVSWTYLTWAFVALGVAVRLFHYFDNRSLFMDEAYQANSLIRMGFGALATQPLEFDQKAPLGFLWLLRLAVLVFGKGEMALRFFPLLAGIASLLLFVPVARHFLRPVGAAVALGMLALAPYLIYHGVEAKPYGLDLLVTIIYLFLYTRYHDKNDNKSLIQWGLWGAVLVWFSFPAVFIVAGMAAGVSLYYLLIKQGTRFWRSLIPFGMWLVSFGLSYLLFTGKRTESGWLIIWYRYRDAFMPLPPTSLADFKWILIQLYLLLDYPLGLLVTHSVLGSNLPRLLLRVVPIGAALLGLVSFYRKDKKFLLVLVFPFLLALAASGLERYPFHERLLVFLAPFVLLLVARGAEEAAYYFTTLPRVVLPALLLAPPLVTSVSQVADTTQFIGLRKTYFREAFQYVEQHFQPGDVVYLYWNHDAPYRYYKEAYPLNSLRYHAIVGHDLRPQSKNMEEYVGKTTDEVKAVAGKHRVWLLYNDMVGGQGDIEGDPAWFYEGHVRVGDKIRDKLALTTPQKDEFVRVGVAARLFDLRENADNSTK
ncbi:glycosyltransferase family 39 protein [Hymenobacter jejuensis]|uniref:Glycosyltransferase family 39 protein n=1 Tax=Hymenobacter jejuensis TaxID=2502781 RepID=A0A5B8A4G0_9BACT|nr:glycosyltransferase family 39 protein [Hymenobacter jejuensis]QDA62201.1 glycosyltransferase family 39 protein [Hymenobacter jejuensis]